MKQSVLEVDETPHIKMKMMKTIRQTGVRQKRNNYVAKSFSTEIMEFVFVKI